MNNRLSFEALLSQLDEERYDIEIGGVFGSYGSIAVATARFGVCNCRPAEQGGVSSSCELCGRKPGNYFSVPGTSSDWRNYLVFEIYQLGKDLPVATICISEFEYSDERVFRRGDTEKVNEFEAKKLSQFKDCELVSLGELEDSTRQYFHDGFGQVPLHIPISIDTASGKKRVYGLRQKNAGEDFSNSVFEGLLVADWGWLQDATAGEDSALRFWMPASPVSPYREFSEGFFEENLVIQMHRERNQEVSNERRSFLRTKATSWSLLGAIAEYPACRKLFLEHYSDITVREASTLLIEVVISGDSFLGGAPEEWTCEGCGGDLLDVPGALCSRCLLDGSKGSTFQAFLGNAKSGGFNFQSEGFFYVNNPVVGFFGNNPLKDCRGSHGYAKSWGEFCDECNQSGHLFPVGIAQGPGIIQSIYAGDEDKASGFVALVEPQEQIRSAIKAVLESALLPPEIGEFASALPKIHLARFPDFESTGELLAGLGEVNFYDFGKPYFPIDLKPETHQVYGLFLSKADAANLKIEAAGIGMEYLERMSWFWKGQEIFEEPQVQVGYLVINREHESLVVNPKRFIDTRVLALQSMLSPKEASDMDVDRDTWKPNALMRLIRFNQSGKEELALEAKSWLLSAELDALAEFHFPGLKASKLLQLRDTEL